MATTVNDHLADLWREFIAEDSPTFYQEYPRNDDGETICKFCFASVDRYGHEPDCIYIRAKTLIEQERHRDAQHA